jgi:hypothetical protein
MIFTDAISVGAALWAADIEGNDVNMTQINASSSASGDKKTE